jgi:predicted acylesterase/phospholipase RssA
MKSYISSVLIILLAT